MCSIYGSKNREITRKIGLNLGHRGQSQKTKDLENVTLGHTLHSIIGYLKQPIKQEGVLSANCELYNWKELNSKYGWNTKNDAETLLKLLDEKGVKGLEEVEGIYAFAYVRDRELILARDLLGVNPIWYSEEKFAFASEKQALEKAGLEAKELHPRHILKYDLDKNTISRTQREFFQIAENEDLNLDDAAEQVKDLFLEAVEKRIPEGELALLFSGGVDSTIIASALQELEKDFTAYTAGIQYGNVNEPRDMRWAQKIAEKMDIPLKSYEASLEEVEEELPHIVDWISTTSVVKNGVALPFHFALNGSEKVVMSGLGSEQLYAGYHRQQGYLNKECLSGLRSIFERDLYRDNVISFRNGYELRVPFLDHNLIEHALTIPEDYKVKDDYRKYVLRKAAEKLGVPEEVVWRKKTAAQYGSNFDKAINRLSKDHGFNHKQEYLNSLRDKPNKKLVALTSGGKDSNAALYRMWRRNNEISCLLTLRSKNVESYMFDSKKTRSQLEEQATMLGIPLVLQNTEGKKEEELEDLEKGINKAVNLHNVEGVVAGALASTYQRDRVDKIAEKLGLKVFTPLWQENQSNYMRWLIREGFKVEVTSVAAQGLAEKWVGKVLDEESVEELISLSKEYRFHAAGEGGEYETRTIDFPHSMK